jgi:DNA-binding MarR family transcriptional regulator
MRLPNPRLETLILYLAVCENEGIGVKELVYICGLSDSMVSRGVDSLCRSGGLLTVAHHATDGRRRLVFLSDEGKALLRELEDILTQPAET